MSSPAAQNERVTVPENFQYLRPAQVAEIERESNQLDQGIRSQLPSGLDKGEMRKRKRALDKMLSEQQAPDLSPSQRDEYSREARRLEGEFTVGMPSAEVMRKNPPGAVDQNLAWHHRNKRHVMRWKNIMRALHKGDTSPDIANIERFRPHTTPVDRSMAGAQIPGRMFVGTNPSPEYRENYERIFGAKDEPQVDVEPKAKPKKPHRMVEMPCGKQLELRGSTMHKRQCKQPACVAAREDAQEQIVTELAGAPPAAE